MSKTFPRASTLIQINVRPLPDAWPIWSLPRATPSGDLNTEICERGSAAENDAAKAVQGKNEIDTADSGRRQNVQPNDRKVRSTIKHTLSESHEMRRRADHLYHVLQPHRHALHGRCASGKQHHDKQYRDAEQPELAHRGCDRAEEDAERRDCEHIKARPPRETAPSIRRSAPAATIPQQTSSTILRRPQRRCHSPGFSRA